MRIAVTGGSGLVGRAVVRLLSDSHDVINIDIAAPGTTGGGPVSEYSPTDILDLPRLCIAVRGADAIVHAAAIPGPSFGTESEILETNVEGTKNVALAAVEESIGRVVFVSSEAVLGFVFSEGRTRPGYFPVDESHPLAPTEVYGRSKLLAETALARSAPPDATVVCLRPPWVWVPEEYDRLRSLTREPSKWSDGLWAYVHSDDLARAVELAATLDISAGFYPAYIAASDNGTTVPTRDLLEEYYPGIPVGNEVTEFGSLLSTKLATRLLGFESVMTWRDFLGEGS